jgi:enoyl-CoA hydratase/carnithine racemase
MARVRTEMDGSIAVVTLDHPERRNSLSREMLEELRVAFERIASDESVRAVVLRANGPVWSAGHDLREVVGGDEAQNRTLFALCTEVMEAVRKLPQPVIAEVHALATAAGCQLAASCDLVVASEEARFATPGVKIGLFCSTPAVALSRAVGPKKAMEMLLTGEAIAARAAEAAGLVNRVVDGARLHEETMALARQIVAASADTLTRGKRAFYAQLPLDRPAAYAVAEEAMVNNAETHDAKEGMTAFLEKRPPRWSKP